MDSPAVSRSPSRGDVGLRAAVVATAVATATVELGRQPLWYDEIASAWASRLPWDGLSALLHRTDANIGVYYALLHLWGFLGHSALLLRLPSALAAVGTVVLTERIGRRLLGRGPGLLAAALLAIHPFAIAYARDARPYALVAFCCTAAILLGLRARERPDAVRWAAYAAVSALAVVLHLYAVLVIGALALVLLPATRDQRLRWAAAHLPVAVVTVVLVVVSLGQRGQLHWVPPVTLMRTVGGLALLSGGYLPMLAVCAAVVVLARLGLPDPFARRLLLVVLVLPPAALLAVSLFMPTFVPRYLDATVPVQCLVLAAAVTHPLVRTRLRAGALVVVVAALLTGAVLQVGASYHYEDFRSASRALLARTRAGDAVVYGDSSIRLGMSYYQPLVREAGQQFPKDALAVPGVARAGFTVPQLTGSAAARALRAYPRIWLVDYASPTRAPLAAPVGAVCDPSIMMFSMRLTMCRR